MRKHIMVFCLLLTAVLYPAFGQQTTGVPPLGSFSGGTFDVVNNANLNVHTEYPIFSRAGRGISFSYTWTYDSAVWSPVTSGSSTVWSPLRQWGWQVITQPQLGYISYQTNPMHCTGPPPGNQYVTWTQLQGAADPVPVQVTVP